MLLKWGGKLKYQLKDLVEIFMLQELTDHLNMIVGIASAIIAMNGEILAGSGWRRICTDFHRKHPDIEKDCIASDIAIRKKIDEGAPFAMYTCPRGLTDASIPIIIEGEHIANAFVGQFFLEPPDKVVEMNFRESAREFGFDEEAYISAFREIPVIPLEKFQSALLFLSQLAQMIAGLGLQRKRELEATARLREIGEDLRVSQQIAHLGSWRLNIATNEVIWSEELYAMYGFDPALPPPSFTESMKLFTPESGEALSTALANTRATGVPYELELKTVRKDGSNGWMWVRGETEVDSEGKTVGLWGAVQDITERKLAEEALWTAEETYRNIFLDSPVGLFRTDIKTGFLLDANDALAWLIGFESREQLLAEPFDIAERYVDSHAREKMISLLKEDGSFRDFKARFRRNDGSIIFIKYSARLRLDKGWLEGVSEDITDRERAKAYGKMSVEILQILNEPAELSVSIQRVLAALKMGTGFDAVGIRLQDGDDFPYFAQEGFSKDFLRTGNTLIERGSDGDVCRDKDGNVCLECACGLVISGKIDPTNPCFTKGGSCWITDGEDTPFPVTRFHPQDRCLHDSFQSVALAPIRNMDRIIGLIQFCDQRKGLLSLQVVESLEGIASRIGAALACKRAEEALRESEERFHYLADAAIEAIFINYKGRCLEANQAAADIFGYDDPSELVGIFGTDVIAPESHEIVKTHMLANSAEPYEAVGLRRDGSKFPVSIHAKFIPYKDIGGVRVTTVRDISDLKEQQRRFQVIAEASADLIYEWDVSTDELLWLGDIDSELGYEPGEIPRTIEGWTGIIHPDDLAILSDAVEQHRRSTQAIHYEYRVRRKDGALRYWEDRGYPVLGMDNLPKKWIGACSDITDKKNIEDQLRQAHKMEAVGRLAGGVAHDFNNILTGINGYSEMIIEGLPADDPLRPNMEVILNSGKRAADLTAQLLAFSRKQIIAPRVIQPNDILFNSQKMLRRIIGEDIDFIFAPGSRLWRINADPTQLDQVLMNLAVNARDAMPDGGKLIIETQNVSLDDEYCKSHAGFGLGDYVMLAVTDTGHGMDEETKSKIFEPFFSTKEVGKGTGLGLSMVYGVMKQNKGFINVYSEVGVGTTFKIYFPALKEKAEKPVKDKLADMPAGTETVLLVEDEDIVRNLTKTVLERQGYTVIDAPNGKKAHLEYTQYSGKIDLLLTDVIMPKMNGRELHTKLLDLKPDLKALFMSGYTEDILAPHGVLGEGAHFLQKPFTIQALAKAVRKALDGV